MSGGVVVKQIVMLVSALVFSIGLTGQFAIAGDVNLNGDGVAIKGYDPVAYFTRSAAVKGSNEFRSEHDGAVYLFSSAQNLATFRANPAKYTPVYGGYCAYGVANGYKVQIDPQAFTVSDGKLYLNYSKPVRGQWLKDVPGYVSKADMNWQKLGG